MRRTLDTLGGLYQLTRLAFVTGFRFRGAYWTWRMHTAFGKEGPPRGETLASVLEYGRWVHRMRRQHM